MASTDNEKAILAASKKENSTQWTDPFPSPHPLAGKLRAKIKLPYLDPGNALQTLDIYIPNLATPHETSKPLWIIYIHGGAWRDPKVTSASFLRTTEYLFRQSSEQKISSHIRGVASINYSLSSHPSHPSGASDGSRTARHPLHLRDVRSALKFLQLRFRDDGIENYILVGHSCGATLAFQTLMDLDSAAMPEVKPPLTVVGVAGLYDLAALWRSPGKAHEWVIPMYREFLAEAFGDDEQTWWAVSPARDVGGGRMEAKGVSGYNILVQSSEDSLVPFDQTNRMHDGLKNKGHEVHVISEQGDHNEIWETGERFANVLWKVMQMVS